MEPKIIIGALIAFVLLYFQFGRGSRLLKKKSHNYIVPPASTKVAEKNRIEIKNDAYDRYIFIKNINESYIIKGIKEYGELSGNDKYKVFNFRIAEYGDWKILKVNQSISFYVYHNLVGWLTGYEENTEVPELIIGFSKNKTDSLEDYLFFLDPENGYGDTQIGTFRNGKSFSIYLPEAYEEYGNLTIKNDIQVSMKENIDYISEKGLNISNIDSLKYTEHKIKMNDL